MITPFILLAIGLLLVLFEFYLPGGIMGTIGALTVLASIVLFALNSESPLYTLLFILGSCTALAFLVKFALWRIRHAEPGYSVYSDQDQEGFHASKYDESAIGKSGVASTDLRLGGRILIDGKRHSALSQSGYIIKGTEIEVIAGQGETLIVKLKI